MLPATIISGFLGAGKTTLINRLLHNPGDDRLAVLVNDFGSVNIDQDLIKVETQNRIELSNGCVCCSIQDDLAAGLVSLSRFPDKFTRVALECSGVSHPAGILKIFDSDPIRELFYVDGLFCLIDTSNLLDLDFRSTELAIDQAAMSDLVFLNKTDLVSEAVRIEVRQTLQAAQQSMKLSEVVRAEIPTAILFGLAEKTRRSRQRAATEGNHSDLYESASFFWDSPVDAGAFKRFCDELPSQILRGKGVLGLMVNRGRPLRAIFQLVGRRSTVEVETADGPEISRIVLIARRGKLDRSAIAKALKFCPGARIQPIARRRGPKRPLISH
ncbi:CobW family GTP-binding protein [Bradyrhizobium sp. STM 3566]|uniref:CobW family GTP-binding protein n=1 Tax=Bradyrhizobium sp. STM 3566 TaxID=578928 RepID=UPI00388E78CE